MDTKVKIQKPKLILCDIEGTTTSISFVKDTLFPFIRKNLYCYLDLSWDTDQTQEDLKLLIDQYKIDKKKFISPILDSSNDEILSKKKFIDEFVRYVLWQMDHDMKTTSLKQLEGHICQYGYQSCQILGHVYADVPICFEKWTNQDIKIGIYSSGSVLAQKMLFSHSEYGDLTKYISYYFDTKIGPKREMASYKAIVDAVQIDASDTLFLSDILEETKAANSAQMNTILVQRDGCRKVDDDQNIIKVVKFEDILF